MILQLSSVIEKQQKINIRLLKIPEDDMTSFFLSIMVEITANFTAVCNLSA